MTGTARDRTDPFAVLGVGRAASPDEVKAAWRRLVALYHPDNNPGFPAEATQKLRELNDAYAMIRDGRLGSGDGASARGDGPGRAATSSRSSHVNPPRRWDPPQPPRPPAGPQVPPPRFADVPPPRTAQPAGATADGAARAAETRRDGLASALAGVGVGGSGDAVADPLVAVLLELGVGGDIRCAVPYARLQVAGPAVAEPPAGSVETTHVAPSLQVGGRSARDEAIARIPRTRFVIVTGDALIWTTSALDDGGDILVRERVAAWLVDRSAVTGLHRDRGTIDLQLSERGALRLTLGRASLVALGAALGLRR